MTVSVHRSESEGGFSELICELPDEAALLSVLKALYTRGAGLLSLERVDKVDRVARVPWSHAILRKKRPSPWKGTGRSVLAPTYRGSICIAIL